MASKKDRLPVSVDELERQMLGSVKASVPALLAAEPAYSTQNIIRVKNQRFYVGEQELPQPVRVVVLGSAFVQAYYEEAYDPDNRTPPVCFALGSEPDKLVPHETAPKKQHDLCLTCPQNKPGTGEKGGFTRACSARRRLAVLLVDDRAEDPVIGSTEISASGLRPFSQYVKSVAGVQGAPLYLVVTELAVQIDTKKDTWRVEARFGGLVTRARPEWVTPPKGVKVGSENWLDSTIVGKKVREVADTKMLLTPPSLVVAERRPAKGKKPVTGARRVSVKDAKAERRGRA